MKLILKLVLVQQHSRGIQARIVKEEILFFLRSVNYHV